MLAVPESVSVPVAVSPFVVDAPMVIVPPAWVIFPLTAKSKAPIAMVPPNPVVSRRSIAALTSTVIVPTPLFPSK
jgi:hypothetical protein